MSTADGNRPAAEMAEPVDVEDWLFHALLGGAFRIPEDGDDWPPAVLDGEPFPLAAAVLGLIHVMSPGPSAYPEPNGFCTVDEELRARRLASELLAELDSYDEEGDF